MCTTCNLRVSTIALGYAELDEKMQSLQATDSGAASRAETTKLLDEETPQEGVATLQAGQK